METQFALTASDGEATGARPHPFKAGCARGPRKINGNKIIRASTSRIADPRRAERADYDADSRMRAAMGRHLAWFGEALKARLNECALTVGDDARIKRCLGELEAAIGQLGPEWCLSVFGSISNGFGTNESDIDATCVCAGADFKPADKEWAKQEASECLKKLIPLLQQHPELSVAEVVFHARVPILKLRHENGLEIDLSCQNTSALENTRLIQAYANLDKRVRDLGVAVKLWAKAAGVCGPPRGHLSSYAFTLMAIYFMQVHVEVKLEWLPPKAFQDTEDELEKEKLHAKVATAVWSCSLSLEELLFRFFWFYAAEFCWGMEVVSTRLGYRLYSTCDQIFSALQGRWHRRLHIEDPYKLGRNLNCVLGEAEEKLLKMAFQEAVRSITSGEVPVGLQAVRSDNANGEKVSWKLTAQAPQATPFLLADEGAEYCDVVMPAPPPPDDVPFLPPEGWTKPEPPTAPPATVLAMGDFAKSSAGSSIGSTFSGHSSTSAALADGGSFHVSSQGSSDSESAAAQCRLSLALELEAVSLPQHEKNETPRNEGPCNDGSPDTEEEVETVKDKQVQEMAEQNIENKSKWWQNLQSREVAEAVSLMQARDEAEMKRLALQERKPHRFIDHGSHRLVGGKNDVAVGVQTGQQMRSIEPATEQSSVASVRGGGHSATEPSSAASVWGGGRLATRSTQEIAAKIMKVIKE